MINLLFKCIISAALIWVTTYVSAASASPNGPYLVSAAERQKSDRYAQTLIDLSERVEAKFYDVDALAEALDFDVENAVQFVETQIHYDPYLGVMRGPEGTLSTESGSSWDQAVLLAALIDAMGGEAMLARGTLPEDEAAALLARGIVSASAPRNALENLDAEAYIADNAGPVTDVPTADVSDGISLEQYEQSADQIASRLMAQMKAEGVPLEVSADSATAYAAALAEEYVWVRYRDVPGEPWRDVHPVFAGETPPLVEAEQYVDNTVPQDRLHKIGLQFHIEVETDGTYKRVQVSGVFERPAAILASIQLRFGISPNTMDLDSEPGFYTPIIGDIAAPGGQAFNMFGQTLDPKDAAAGPAIFATVGNKLGSAITGLSDGDDSGVPKLTGVFLTITHTAPGGQKISEERRLTDFRDGRPENYQLEMVTRGTLEVDIGAENGARNYVSFLESASAGLRQLPYIGALVAGDVSPNDLIDHPAFDLKPSHNWLETLAIGDIMNPISDGGRVVRMSPLIMIKRDVLSADKSAKFLVDVQHNRVRGFSINQDGQPIENPALALRQGVLETLVEGEMIGYSGIKSWKTEDLMRLVSEVEQLQADPIWGASSLLAQDRMLADLNLSGHLIIPNNQQEHWWRVDPSTGVILGMGHLGGQETAEYEAVMSTIGLAVTFGFLTYGLLSGYEGCVNSGKSQAFQNCCLAVMVGANVGLAFGGGVVLHKLSNAYEWSAAIGLIASIGFDAVTGLPSGDEVRNPVTDVSNRVQEEICDYFTGD